MSRGRRWWCGTRILGGARGASSTTKATFKLYPAHEKLNNDKKFNAILKILIEWIYIIENNDNSIKLKNALF